MVKSRSLLALAGWSVFVASATDVVYVTDLSIFSVLAPCAQAAVSGVIDYETESDCPTGASALQSCICTKNSGNNRASISSLISTCGSTATDDQASAATVLAGYCNQDAITPFPSPSITVTDYIVDLSAYHNLAPCAQSAVEAGTWDKCQADASLLATCACQKDNNSQYVSSLIDSSVRFNCDGHTADVSSALEIFSGYCGLVEGTTSFPTTSDPPGDMTYYITALSQFSALAPCAQTAVSYNVLHQTEDLCPTGPQALASCACLRSEMTGTISSMITSDARYYCSSRADDISSAIDVWDLYCSAAKGLTTPAGITETVSQATTSPETRTNGAQQTSSTGSASGNGTDSDGTTTKTTMTNTAVVAGAVVGAVVGTALIAVVAFLLYRRSKKAQAAAQAAAVPDPGKPELDSTAVAPPPTGSPSPSMMKTRMENSSPISAMSSAYAAPPMPELHNQPPRTPELQGHEAISPRTPNEAYSQQVFEAPGQYRPPVPQVHGQPMSELQGIGWQSGPVPQAYEMDGSNSGTHTHVR
ncbi:hypothetical protein F4825DRAFT_467311 [Nemania diffusa]|nr:hypothetical protein F4825DRAFT_467311 [Nemania diffusa]